MASGVVQGHEEDLDRLAEHIRRGRCVAFVGAGVSSDGDQGAPTWVELLKKLADELPADAATRQGRTSREALRQWSAKLNKPSSLELEAFGEALRDAFPDPAAFHEAVGRVACGLPQKSDKLKTRRQRILDIPFRAVLTTNYDDLLDPEGGPRPEVPYREVLRDSWGWWSRFATAGEPGTRSRVIKLHGDAAARPEVNPVVLGRRDYRRRLYEDSRYGAFLRAMFATNAVLFLGVSFTDAYLNELRSEVIALLHSGVGRGGGTARVDEPPWFAVMPELGTEHCKFFRDVEGIAALPYPAPEVQGTECSNHQGFDDWLEAIWKRTAPSQRLHQLLHQPAGAPRADRPRVVWYDPNPENNQLGADVLGKLGVGVVPCRSIEDLHREDLVSARLIISRYGHRSDGTSDAIQLLDAISRRGERPPVIVFASGDHAAENRWRVLRHGAYEYACQWDELFEHIERLLGRPTGWGRSRRTG